MKIEIESVFDDDLLARIAGDSYLKRTAHNLVNAIDKHATGDTNEKLSFAFDLNTVRKQQSGLMRELYDAAKAFCDEYYYRRETINSIRQCNQRLAGYSDAHLSALYHSYSTELMSASWLLPTDSGIKAFCVWATTAPCDELWTD